MPTMVNGDPRIEDLSKLHSDSFNRVILVSVFEHVINPFEYSDAIFRPGGYLSTLVLFLFPIHDTRDHWRFSQRLSKTFILNQELSIF